VAGDYDAAQTQDMRKQSSNSIQYDRLKDRTFIQDAGNDAKFDTDELAGTTSNIQIKEDRPLVGGKGPNLSPSMIQSQPPKRTYEDKLAAMKARAEVDPVYAAALANDPRFAGIQKTRSDEVSRLKTEGDAAQAEAANIQQEKAASKSEVDEYNNAMWEMQRAAENISAFNPASVRLWNTAVEKFKSLGGDPNNPRPRAAATKDFRGAPPESLNSERSAVQQRLADMGTHSPGRAEAEADLRAIDKELARQGVSPSGGAAPIQGRTTTLGEGGQSSQTFNQESNIGMSRQGLSSAPATSSPAPLGTTSAPIQTDPNTRVSVGGNASRSYQEIANIIGQGATADTVAQMIRDGYGIEITDEPRILTPDGDYWEDLGSNPNVGNIVAQENNKVSTARGEAQQAQNTALVNSSLEDLRAEVNKPINLTELTAGYDRAIEAHRKSSARNKALALKAMQEQAAMSGMSVNQLVGASSESGQAYDTQNQAQDTMLNLQKQQAIYQETARQTQNKIQLAQQIYNRATTVAEQQEARMHMDKLNVEQEAARARQAEIEAEMNSPSLAMQIAKIGVGVGGAVLAPFTGGASLAASGAILGTMGAVEAANASNAGYGAYRNMQAAPGSQPGVGGSGAPGSQSVNLMNPNAWNSQSPSPMGIRPLQMDTSLFGTNIQGG
jgi:hypothetical protein